VSSPTGSGKTVIFELAIINFLETFNNQPNSLANSKIIYGKTFIVHILGGVKSSNPLPFVFFI